MRTVQEPELVSRLLIMSAVPTAPSCARKMSRLQLGEWGLSGLSDTAGLIVSELVTNAVRVCRDRRLPAQVTLRLSMEGRLVRIEVWDPDPSPPSPAGDVGPLDESGRGLHLVDAMSGGRWGARPCPEGGKVVWAELAPPLPP